MESEEQVVGETDINEIGMKDWRLNRMLRQAHAEARPEQIVMIIPDEEILYEHLYGDGEHVEFQRPCDRNRR